MLVVLLVLVRSEEDFEVMCCRDYSVEDSRQGMRALEETCDRASHTACIYILLLICSYVMYMPWKRRVVEHSRYPYSIHPHTHAGRKPAQARLPLLQM